MSASPQALAAVKAAKNVNRWGAYATGRFLARHGVPMRMFVIAAEIEEGRAA